MNDLSKYIGNCFIDMENEVGIGVPKSPNLALYSSLIWKLEWGYLLVRNRTGFSLRLIESAVLVWGFVKLTYPFEIGLKNREMNGI